MPALSNPKWEKFAQLVASGESCVSAYRKVYKASQKTAEGNAHAVMESHGVRARVREIQEAGAKKVEWSIADRLQFLKEAALTPVGEIDENHKLCSGVKQTMFGPSYRTPDKLRATELYSKLNGDMTEKTDVTVTIPGSLEDALRAMILGDGRAS